MCNTEISTHQNTHTHTQTPASTSPLLLMENLLVTHRITIPPLQCSFPIRCHPDLHEIEEAGNAWILSNFNPSSECERKLLLQCQYPLYVCAIYVTCDKRRCLSIVKYIAWLFLFDDISDDLNGVGDNLSAAEELYRCLFNALEVKASSHALHTFVKVALDWWTEISQDMPAMQKSRFLTALTNCIDAWKVQISFREVQRIPDVQTYIRNRREASAMCTFFILLEYSVGIEFDEETLKNELLCKVHEAVIDHVSWVNDLLSLKVEYSRGLYENLPSVVFFNESHDFQDSVLRVCTMIEDKDGDFLRLTNEIKKSNLMKIPGFESYLDGLGYCMSGNLSWSYVTARYHGVDENPKPIDKHLHIVLQPAAARSKP